MLAVADMIFIGFIGLFVVLPIVAILSERGRKQPKKPDADPATQQKIDSLEATIKQQQSQIQELKELLTINILKNEDEESFQRRLNNSE